MVCQLSKSPHRNAFDRVSRDLKIPWDVKKSLGAGPMLEIKAALYDPQSSSTALPKFPLAMPRQLGFSFGGLVASVERYIERAGPESPFSDASETGGERPAIAHAFQTAAVWQLEEKVSLALDRCTRKGVHIRELVVSGGVASNVYLRNRHVTLYGGCFSTTYSLILVVHRLEAFLEPRGVTTQYPPIEFCTGASQSFSGVIII